MEAEGAGDGAAQDRLVTVPNGLSFVRLVGVPLFLWLLLGPQADGWAFVVLVVSGITDWLDGKLARVLDQSSRLGALLDPAIDRLYMIVVPIGLGVRDIMPWWMLALILGRELLLAFPIPLLSPRGITALPVLYLGKAATFALMTALPMLLAGTFDSWFGDIMHPLGWAVILWGIGLYLWTLVLYWIQTLIVVRRYTRDGQPRTGLD